MRNTPTTQQAARVRRLMAGVAAIVVAFLVAGCSHSGGGQPKHEADASKSPSISASNDGGLAIATVNSYITQFRAGHGALACGYLAPSLQKTLAQTPAQMGLEAAKGGCPKAVTVLNDHGYAPDPVPRYTVESTTDISTDLTLHRKGQPDVTMTVNLVDPSWLISDVSNEGLVAFKAAFGTASR